MCVSLPSKHGERKVIDFLTNALPWYSTTQVNDIFTLKTSEFNWKNKLNIKLITKGLELRNELTLNQVVTLPRNKFISLSYFVHFCKNLNVPLCTLSCSVCFAVVHTAMCTVHLLTLSPADDVVLIFCHPCIPPVAGSLFTYHYIY